VVRWLVVSSLIAMRRKFS